MVKIRSNRVCKPSNTASATVTEIRGESDKKAVLEGDFPGLLQLNTGLLIEALGHKLFS